MREEVDAEDSTVVGEVADEETRRRRERCKGRMREKKRIEGTYVHSEGERVG